MPDPFSRRSFVGAMASAVGATWMAGAWGVRLPAGVPPGSRAAPAPPVLAAREVGDLEALTALILPTDDTPGAREARSVDFITRGLATFAQDQQPLFQRGLADLAARAAAQAGAGNTFADLDGDAQLALTKELESEKSEFFEAVRVATIAGFLANPEYGGNADKVGWKLIGFEDRFAWQAPFGDYDHDPDAR